MAAITVGVPVYNGAAHLAECLDCLLGQTFKDLKILVFDNASTDETPQIAADYAARDPRVRYHRQPHNKGALLNFSDLARAATSPYFLWRAADDRSDANYIEVLHALLQAHPDKQLAVGRVTETFQGQVVKARDVAPRLDRLGLMFGAHATAIYGLFRTPAIAEVMTLMGDRYGSVPWGWDFVALLPFFLDESVAASDQVSIEFGVRGAPRAPGAPRPPRKEADFDVMLGVRARFLALVRDINRRRNPPGPRRWAGEILVWAYANQRVYKVKRIVRRTLTRWLTGTA
ncbi:glycosyltransferase family 2 protein [Phenylobacterium montanum]|uniref:Glycosyltransferase family 2 protein n=1 Tax=Phenylobacterium montanum TaxID=2823693 RepID=A0A975IU28_9CAUL|nr:glycosyltransferase family A protein [Caulobacter sp. S6]QUD87330.1 glycosyltransferase family 2 protein [Caulobacter sp. S6]